MQLARYLHREDILSDSAATTKDEILRDVSRLLARKIPALDQEAIYRLLEDREQVQSTAVGDGIAIPHAKTGSIAEPVCCLVRSPSGVPFGAQDGRPSHLFFGVLAPESDLATHLKLLARVSRLFGEYRTQLLEARDEEEMFQVILESDRREAGP